MEIVDKRESGQVILMRRGGGDALGWVLINVWRERKGWRTGEWWCGVS